MALQRAERLRWPAEAYNGPQRDRYVTKRRELYQALAPTVIKTRINKELLDHLHAQIAIFDQDPEFTALAGKVQLLTKSPSPWSSIAKVILGLILGVIPGLIYLGYLAYQGHIVKTSEDPIEKATALHNCGGLFAPKELLEIVAQ
ncbi:MAG: hypothetical protein HY069_00915 [Chlamydiia bacterium]|nr:hypothetical protein [Chlamydiia bacterium]